MKSTLTKNQFTTKEKIYIEDGQEYRIKAKIRFDDDCGNGHNTFSITGTIWEKSKYGRWVDHSGGCIHDEIAKHFPELKEAIQYHLVSTDGPIRYIANTLYHASNRDCWGKLKGEPYQFKQTVKFDCFPLVFDQFSEDFISWIWATKTPRSFEVVAVPHPPDNHKYGDKYTFKGYPQEWYKCPFDKQAEAEQFAEAFGTLPFQVLLTPTSFGEGKELDLDAARRCAIWPDATLEQLQDKAALEKHWVEVEKQFIKIVESFGFTY